MLLNKYYEGKIEAGCDEAGRGCLAGSVYAAAVILPEGYQNELLNDSKQLSEKKRYQLREMIERDAVAWAVGIVTPEEIDKINILNASILAMHRALDQLKVRPEAVIVDGNKFKPYKDPANGKQLPLTFPCHFLALLKEVSSVSSLTIFLLAGHLDPQSSCILIQYFLGFINDMVDSLGNLWQEASLVWSQ